MLLDIRPDHLKIVQDILQKCVPEREVWAFGSRAKWRAKEYSDLDLCILGKTPLSFRTLGLLEEAFEDSDLPYKVDVVDWATTSESFRQIIERDKVVVPKGGWGMSSGFQKTKLGKLITFANGKSSPERFDNAKFAVFGSNGLIGKANDSNSPANSIVVGRVGSYCGAVHFSRHACWVTDNAIKATAKEDNDPSFLFYFLKHLNLNNWRSGSGQPLINQSTLNAIEVCVPPSVEQKAIGGFLSSLDDRITLLRETNATLEAIAQALFKSWFVDFDPVRAKQEGRTSEGMDEATAALFPDSFEASELGLVPKGWRVVRLDSFVELAYGKALKAENRKAGSVPVYGSGGITGWHNQALVDQTSVIVGRKGTVGSLYWESRPFFPIDTVFYVKSRKPLTYCYLLLKTLGLDSMNTDAAVPGLNRENVYRLLVTEPPENILAAFDDIASVLRASMDENDQQAQTLATLRDTLLPRLISGQLRLPEAEAEIEGVTA